MYIKAQLKYNHYIPATSEHLVLSGDSKLNFLNTKSAASCRLLGKI